MVDDGSDIAAFRAARDFLLDQRDNYAAAYDQFRWPALTEFNWARDWFDGVLAAERPHQPALWLVTADSETQVSFAEMSRRSSQVAGWLREQRVRKGDRILLFLGNSVPLWEIMLAAAKIGASVETVPSIRPISAGWTRWSMNRSSSADPILPASLATNSAMTPYYK